MKFFFSLILILIFYFLLISKSNKYGSFENLVFDFWYERYDSTYDNWKVKFFSHDNYNNIWSVYFYKNDELFVKMFAQIDDDKSIYMSNFFRTDIIPDKPISFVGCFLSTNDLILVNNMKKFDNETLYFKKKIFIGET